MLSQDINDIRIDLDFDINIDLDSDIKIDLDSDISIDLDSDINIDGVDRILMKTSRIKSRIVIIFGHNYANWVRTLG